MSSAFAAIAAASGLVRGATPLPASVCDLVSVYAAAATAGALLQAATMADPAPLRNLLQPAARDDVLRAFRAACRRGDQRLARWLAARFGLAPADARANDNAALRRACAGGHLEAAQRLASHFGLTAADACETPAPTTTTLCADDNYALRRACENGHLEVARWLAAHFGLTPADACETPAPRTMPPCAGRAGMAGSRRRSGWQPTSASPRPTLARRPRQQQRRHALGVREWAPGNGTVAGWPLRPHRGRRARRR